MERYTVAQRIEIVKIYYKNNESIRATFRALREIYGQHNRPTELTIRNLIQKFESNGSVCDVKNPTRQKRKRIAENIDAVNQSVNESPEQSITRRSQELGLSYGITWNMLHKDLHFKAYKIQLTQELKPNDHLLRRNFADWALEQLETDPLFHEKIIFSDEAHFWLNGFINTQNCRIWSKENPHAVLETPLHPQKLTVWCGLWSGGVIGPYFFENENGNAVTVNGERYRNMITDFFWHELDDFDLEDMWFQQDGATCHTSRDTINLLREKFNDRVISRNADVTWPPRSCDITPLDFFLWGYVKSLVYSNKPQTLNDLKTNIIRVIGEISAGLCGKVTKNWCSRIEFLKKSRGGHLQEIIFKQ